MLQAGAVKASSGRGSPKGKGQPVYARIITPPPGMKLTGVPGVAGLQAVGGKLLAPSPVQQAVPGPVASRTVPSPGVGNSVVSAPAQNDSSG